jgi:hypothetical protein
MERRRFVAKRVRSTGLRWLLANDVLPNR